MTKLSLFSGIGGDDLASEWAGIKTVCFCEKDKYCQQVLRKHWPDVPIIEDVKDVTKKAVLDAIQQSRQVDTEDRLGMAGDLLSEAGRDEGANRTITSDRTGIDLISGGFPCQPHSLAGKRKGSSDERNLWPEFRRVIGEIKPQWVLVENVPGLFSSDSGRFFGEILSDLASLGYSVGWCTYGAVDVGALHQRNRVFIVAHGNSPSTARQRVHGGKGLSVATSKQLGKATATHTIRKGLEVRQEQDLLGQCQTIERSGTASDPASWSEQSGSPQCDVGRFQDETVRVIWDRNYWAVEPDVGRVAHGVPHRVDRLKGLGNAVVPQQIYPIYRIIADIEGV